MSNNSAPLFDRYAEMDFSDAQPVSEIPALATASRARRQVADNDARG